MPTIRHIRDHEQVTFLERMSQTSWDDLVPHQKTNRTRKEIDTNVQEVVSFLMGQGESRILIADLPDLSNAGQLWLGRTRDPYTYKWRSYIYNLFVEPAARQQGVAQALLQAAEEMARKRGDNDLVLTVACHNDSALALYHRVGFTDERLILSKPLEE